MQPVCVTTHFWHYTGTRPGWAEKGRRGWTGNNGGASQVSRNTRNLVRVCHDLSAGPETRISCYIPGASGAVDSRTNRNLVEMERKWRMEVPQMSSTVSAESQTKQVAHQHPISPRILHGSRFHCPDSVSLRYSQ